METISKNNKFNRHMGAGIFMMTIGLVWMLENLGLNIPHWVLSWSSIMLALGIWIGYRKDFKAGGWIILVLIGGLYTLRDMAFFDLSRVTGALVLMGIGIYLILKPRKVKPFWDFSGKRPVDFGDCHRRADV